MIWERALPGPRLVTLKQKKLKKTVGQWEVETGQTWPPPREDLQEEIARAIQDPSSSSRWQAEERDVLSEALDAYEHGDAYKAGHLVGLASNCQMPEIMAVSREAYEVGSKSYQRVFSCLGSIPTTCRYRLTRHSPSHFSWISLNSTHFLKNFFREQMLKPCCLGFSFELDILYLLADFPAYFADGGLGMITEELSISAFAPTDVDNFRRVRNLAVRGFFPEESESANLLRIIGDLEKLYLVFQDYQEEEHDPRYPSLMQPISFHQTIMSLDSDTPLRRDLNPGRDFDLEMVKDILDEDISLGKPRWKIPKIQKSVILTENMVRELESAKRNF